MRKLISLSPLLFALACGANDASDTPREPSPSGTAPGTPAGSGSGDAGSDGAKPDPVPGPNDTCKDTLNPDGWCWAVENHPMSTLSNFVPFADDDVWANAGHALVRWDGKGWSVRHFDAAISFRALSGSSPTSLFAAGRRSTPGVGSSEGVLYRFDGKAWVEVAKTAIEISAMWAASAKDVWLGTQSKAIYHWDGATVTEAFPPSQSVGQALRAFDGSSATDVWAVGDQGDGTGPVRHFDGASWTQVTGPFKSGHAIVAVRAFAPNDVWVGGGYDQIHHFDGTGWTTLALPSGLTGVVVSITGKPNDVSFALTRDGGKNQVGDVALLHWDGQALTSVAVPADGEAYRPPLSALAITPSGALLVSRGAGDVYRRASGTYTRLGAGPQIDYEEASSSPSGRIAATGNSNRIGVYESGAWQSTPALPDGRLVGVVASDKAIAALGSEGRFVLVGAAGAGVVVSTPFGTHLPSALVGNAVEDLWAMDGGEVWHRSGATWTALGATPALSTVRKLLVTKTNVIYATTRVPEALMRLDGTTWTKAWTHPVRAAVAQGTSIWGLRAGAGSGSAILRDDAVVAITDPKLEAESTYAQLLTVCADGRVYASVYGYEILAFDGAGWKIESANAAGLTTLHCDAQGTVWGFGSDGVVVKKPKK